jgi:hypothetical protein
LIERAAAAIVPIGLEAVVDAVTGARLVDSPLALDFARRVVASLKDTLMTAGRSLNLDLRLDLPALAVKDAAAPESPLLAAGKLHAQAGAGNAVVPVDDSAVAIHLLQQAWLGSAVARVQLVNKASDVQQGELLVAHE